MRQKNTSAQKADQRTRYPKHDDVLGAQQSENKDIGPRTVKRKTAASAIWSVTEDFVQLLAFQNGTLRGDSVPADQRYCGSLPEPGFCNRRRTALRNFSN